MSEPCFGRDAFSIFIPNALDSMTIQYSNHVGRNAFARNYHLNLKKGAVVNAKTGLSGNIRARRFRNDNPPSNARRKTQSAIWPFSVTRSVWLND